MEQLFIVIAKHCQWLKTVNDDWRDKVTDALDQCEKMLPHGSGFDAGCKIDREGSGQYRIFIDFEYHHLNGNGYYDGWTKHKATITPALTNVGFELKITGKKKNDINTYLHDIIWECLTKQVDI